MEVNLIDFKEDVEQCVINGEGVSQSMNLKGIWKKRGYRYRRVS